MQGGGRFSSPDSIFFRGVGELCPGYFCEFAAEFDLSPPRPADRGHKVLRSFAITAAVLLATTSTVHAAGDQCLTPSELQDAARMSAIMGLGGALKRCGSCLGDRYQETVDKFEASGMLLDFRRSEAAIQSSREKFFYADDLVRVGARKYASDLSADCNACAATADLASGLSSEEARGKLYDAEAERITKLSSFKRCP